MKKILLTLFLLFAPSVAFAQCTGVFPANTVCGNLTASAAPPKAVSFSSSGLVGPGSSTIGHFATWNNITGNLLADFDLYGNANTWTAANIFTAGVKFTGLSAGTQVSCLGLDSGNNIVTVASACNTTTGIPVGTSLNYRGFTAPSGFLIEGGQAVSRVTYSDLFGVMTFTSTASTTSGSKVITGISSTTTLGVGMPVGGNRITCGDTIASVDSPTQVTLLTNNASSTGSTTLTFAPFGVGDCSTTFNVPDSRGRIDAGNDNPTGGAGLASRITVAGASCLGTVIGTGCGFQNQTLTTAQLPIVTPTGTVNILTGATGGITSALDTFTGTGSATPANATTITASFSGTPFGSGNAHPILNPVLMTNRIIKY